MTVPPIRKWKWPTFHFYKNELLGWQMFLYVNPDHNPILIVSWWNRRLDVQAFERNIWRSSR